MSMKVSAVPRVYVWRRVHSLFGLWIVLFLAEHLFTNSQAALFFGDNGMGFIRAVNFIKGLPYLQVVETLLIGVPILVHGGLGVKYLFTSKMNSFKGDGSKPSLPKYPRNKAYNWQRITSWILLLGIILHVSYMRFYTYPIAIDEGSYSSYVVRVSLDKGLYTVAERLNVKLYDQQMVQEAKSEVATEREKLQGVLSEAKQIQEEKSGAGPLEFSAEEENILDEAQGYRLKKEWVHALEKKSLKEGQVLAVANNFGTATLLTVRNSFKSPFIGFLYTIFVLAAVFHGFNGLWTFFISWGVVIKMRSQARAVNFCVAIMAIIGFLGLASIWGTYWINLRN